MLLKILLYVVSAKLGGRLSRGLFIAHAHDGKSPTNYKLAAWQDIETVIEQAQTNQPPKSQ